MCLCVCTCPSHKQGPSSPHLLFPSRKPTADFACLLGDLPADGRGPSPGKQYSSPAHLCPIRAPGSRLPPLNGSPGSQRTTFVIAHDACGLQGRQGSRGCIPGSPGESGLVSRGSQGIFCFFVFFLMEKEKRDFCMCMLSLYHV